MAQQGGRPPRGSDAPGQMRSAQDKKGGGGNFQDHTIPEGQTELTLDVPEGQKIVCPRGRAEPKVDLRVEGNRIVLDQPAPAGGVRLKAKVVEDDEPDEPDAPAEPDEA